MGELAPADVERRCWAIVRHEVLGSSLSAAAEELGIGASALRSFKQAHLGRIVEIREREAAKMRSLIAAQSEDLAVEYMRAEREALAQLQEKLDQKQIGSRDLALTVKHLAGGKKEAVAAARQARGDATAVVEVRGVDEIMRQLARLMPRAFDGEAEVIPSADVEKPAG